MDFVQASLLFQMTKKSAFETSIKSTQKNLLVPDLENENEMVWLTNPYLAFHSSPASIPLHQ